MNRKYLLLLLCICILPVAAFTQETSVTVSGIIKDKSAAAVLPFVNVVIKAGEDSALCNRNCN